MDHVNLIPNPITSQDKNKLTHQHSIEGSTIIIAACIPVLQPLVDLVLGRRTLGSSNGYKNYGTSRSGQLKSDAELESSRRTAASRNAGGNLDKFDNASDYTTRDKTGVDSQDSILYRADDLQTIPTKTQSGKENPPAGKIVRTDVVTVLYEAESLEGKNDNRQWGGI